MQIQVNTDNVIHGDTRVIEVAEEAVRADLGLFDDRLTRIEVHLKEQNSASRGPKHFHCMIEARPRGLDPLAANHDAEDIQGALKGAAKTLRGRLSALFDKRDPHR